jgi:hypothetical protein
MNGSYGIHGNCGIRGNCESHVGQEAAEKGPLCLAPTAQEEISPNRSQKQIHLALAVLSQQGELTRMPILH